MKRGRHHIGPVRRWLRWFEILEDRHEPVLSQGWSSRFYAQLRLRFRAAEARRRLATTRQIRRALPFHQVGGPQTDQGN